ncbi:MAG: DMT family transporter [Clostridia bacterium]|nr:DMT family transporter [Clostridia bacterium]
MPKKNFILCALTAIIWGFAFTAQRIGGDHLGNFSYNAIRYLLGTVSLLPVVFLFEKRNDEKKLKPTLLYGLAAGVVLFIASSLQQAGVIITQSAGKSGFITGLYIILVPFIGLFLGKRIKPSVFIAAPLSLLGLFLVSWGDEAGFSWGDVVLLIGAVFWALHILVIDAAGEKVYSLRFSVFQFFVCAILNLICMPLFESITVADVRASIIPLLYGGIMSSGVAYTLQILGQKNADPAICSLVLSTETVFSAIGGALILHETMSARAYVGCVLIFCAILLCQLSPRLSRRKHG